MTHIVRIERLGEAGTPFGPPRIYEATDAADAITIAAYEVDARPRGRPRVATVTDTAGRLLFTYSGRVPSIQAVIGTTPGDTMRDALRGRRIARDFCALDDHNARASIDTGLTLVPMADP